MNVSILMLIARIALAVCLYAFLLLILVALWRDVRAAGGHAAAGTPLMSLRRLRPDGAPERSYPLEKDACFIGRSPSVEVSLADETVSVVHARLWRQGGRWWLEDLDSRNGTMLNEIPVAKPAVLCAGDRIGIGRIQLEFHAEEPATPLPHPDPDR
jgi:pSer/pThr/pTyr-binding forkhead associated (FHA) protein